MYIKTIEIAGLKSSIKAMRNPMNSWELSDSYDRLDFDGKFSIGNSDLDLAQRLIKAGSEHSKFTRDIQVWADFNMPRYFWQEFDQYKFHTTNSCSTMHTITKRLLTLNDFTYSFTKELPNQIFQKHTHYKDSEVIFKKIKNHENYEVSNDGRIKNISKDKLLSFFSDSRGYSKTSLNEKQYSVHRLVANAFIENTNNLNEVNHKNGNKLDNRVENLEWVSSKDNKIHASENKYQVYLGVSRSKQINSIGKLTKKNREDILELYSTGEYTHRSLGEKYNLSHSVIGNLIRNTSYNDEISSEDNLIYQIYSINKLINEFNRIKDNETKRDILLEIKRLLPESFLQLRTVNTNYAELRNIWLQRVNTPHKLKEEWVDTFGEWVLTLPYAKELICFMK